MSTPNTYQKHLETLAQIERLDSSSALAECEKARINVRRVGEEIADNYKRLDAGETANLARALLYLRAQSIDVIYAKTGFRTVLPLKTDIPLGAKTYSVPQYDFAGNAKLITNYADDLPRVNAQLSEVEAKIKAYGTSYEYSIEDLAAAAMSGNMLDAKRQRAAKDVLERKHDAVACLGDAAAGLNGFANTSGVDAVSLAAAGTWATKAAAGEGFKIYNDIVKLIGNIIDDTVGEFKADTLAMNPGMAHIVRTTIMNGTGTGTDGRTVYEALRGSGIALEILEWQRLALADAGLDGPRVVAFQRDPNVVEYVAPGGGFTEEAPQMSNLAFVVNCHGRSAGTCVYQPKALSYMDVG